MLYLTLTLVVALIISICMYTFLIKETRQTLKISIISGIFSFSLSLLLIRLLFQASYFLIQTTPDLILYTLSLLGSTIFCILITFLAFRSVPHIKKHPIPLWKIILSGTWKSIILVLFTLGTFTWLWSDWFISFFGELTPEQFLFNLNSPIKGTSSSVTNQMFHTPLLLVFCISSIFFSLLFIHVPNRKAKWNLIKTSILSIISFLMLTFGISYSIQTLHLTEVYRAFSEGSSYIEQHYTNPEKVALAFPQKKRNLIHIYAESVESSYFSKELGGYSDENLMPHLYELTKSGIHFSHNTKMGGSQQTYGSSWSVAGMVNMESGVPLKIPMDGNSYGKAGEFLPGITNLGDILHNQGYNQTIMFGSDAEFGGLDVYFSQHGKYHIFDVKEARKKGLIPQNYNVWWGFEDDKLYDFAKSEITRLYKEGKPFHFNMENADTHFPDGYVSKNVKRSRSSQYADVIAYSDAQIAQFVKWIQAQPFYDNTTIVITGDHLSMDKKFFEKFDPHYKRTPFNVFINAPKNKKTLKQQNRQFAPLDMFPTILSSLDVRIPGNKLGLGTDLFSGAQTLIEHDGFEKFNRELGKRSDFYDTHFVATIRKQKK